MFLGLGTHFVLCQVPVFTALLSSSKPLSASYYSCLCLKSVLVFPHLLYLLSTAVTLYSCLCSPPLQTWQGQRKRTNAGPLLSGQHQKNIGNRCEALTRMGLVWLLRWPLKTSLVAFADSDLCEGFPRTAPGDSRTPAGCPTTQVTSDTVYLGTASDPTNLCPLETPLTSPGCHLSFSPASYIGRRPPHSVLGFRLLQRFREKTLLTTSHLSFLFLSSVFFLLLACFMMLFAYRKMMERLEEFPYSESPGEPHLQGEITSQPPGSALQAAPLCSPLS